MRARAMMSHFYRETRLSIESAAGAKRPRLCRRCKASTKRAVFTKRKLPMCREEGACRRRREGERREKPVCQQPGVLPPRARLLWCEAALSTAEAWVLIE